MKSCKDALIFGENIKRLRINHKLTKKKMCEIMGIGIKSLNTIEKGIIPKRLDLTAILALVKYFNIALADLFTNHENTQDNNNTNVNTNTNI